MKKIALCLMATCLLLTFQPLQSNAANATASSSLVIPKPIESAKAKILLLRLNEIKTMDKSNLKSSEKKNLRIEVRSIKHQLRGTSGSSGGGVYLSVGAIIIIALLLIILL